MRLTRFYVENPQANFTIQYSRIRFGNEFETILSTVLVLNREVESSFIAIIYLLMANIFRLVFF